MKKATTFKNDGKRRILCVGCSRFITESHLGEKKQRYIKCKGCGPVNIITPPRKTTFKGQKVILYGPNEGLFTADLAEDEIEESL